MRHLSSSILLVVAGLCCWSFVVTAQQKVDPRNRYERLICIVPMIGSGTYEDPRRPAYVPTDQDREKLSPEEAILGYSFILSDDEQWALVEFAAIEREAFSKILADAKGELSGTDSPIPLTARPDFKVFEKGKVTRVAVERAFRKFKQNLNLATLGVSLP